jgi:lipopolysaccharide biosynthesis glycosyltransferase
MINVCYCGNYGIFKGLLLSSLSLVKVTSGEINIHILTANMTYLKPSYTPINDSQATFLEKNLQAINPECHVFLHDATALFKQYFAKGRNTKSMYTPFAFLRLLMDQIHELPDKLLYLDVDTIVLKDLNGLFDLNLGGASLGAVHDSMRGKEYFNSGVILFNLKKIIEEKSFEQARNYLFSHKLMMPDQDTLNRIYKNDKVLLSRIYNEQRDIKKDTVIRHYCQSIHIVPYFHIIKAKPWEDRFVKAYPHEANHELLDEYHSLLAAYK